MSNTFFQEGEKFSKGGFALPVPPSYRPGKRSCRYGKCAFLFCHNVRPSCCDTMSQFCHDAW